MQPTSDDKLAASVFEMGLTFGFVRREDVVRWADRRIMEMDNAPEWLIDISLSQNRQLTDLVSSLNEVGKGAGDVATLASTLAMLPDVKSLSPEEAESLGKFIYRIARHLIIDWDNQLLREASDIDDSFELARRGILPRREILDELARFVERHGNKNAPRVLYPAVWSHALHSVTPIRDTDIGRPLVQIGLSAWIIQDGNYRDFEVEQEAEFALEFYPPQGLQPAHGGPPLAAHLRDSRYFIRGRIVFVGSNVWVIDAETFMAYEERQPPAYAIVGTWVEGEIYVGIDPFFYFEYLHRIEGMPPLTYKWLVRAIDRETTPWIEATDAVGRRFWSRDQQRESFVPARKTDAWHDDDGNAAYVLTCERLSGPERPGPQ